MTATVRQKALAEIERLGAEFYDYGDRNEFMATVWAPVGKVWASNFSHNLSYHYHTDRPAGWLSLVEDLSEGVADCTTDGCEHCGSYQEDDR